MSRFITALLISVLAWSGAAPSRAAELVMFEAGNCEWCEVWEKEVGVVYAKTTEAKAAPLRRVDIIKPRPADLSDIKGVRYTPTFVLVEQGREVGRMVGYPGEDFFWELLGGLIKKLPAKAEHACATPGTATTGGKPC